jgi:hypothetical protein
MESDNWRIYLNGFVNFKETKNIGIHWHKKMGHYKDNRLFELWQFKQLQSGIFHLI